MESDERNKARETEQPRRRQSDSEAASPNAASPKKRPLKVESVTGSVYGQVARDDKGDAVWEWRVDVPSRREDDETINYLRCLTDVDLEIADGDDVPEKPGGGYNPYDRSK
jgi:hypothetical protein